MIQTLQNIFKIPDLRRRILFTLGLLAIYRIGAFIPIPGINLAALREFFAQSQNSLVGLVNLFTGGNFQNLTIFALGIMPYISASIILQLLAVIWPYLEKLQKEGEVGRRKITQYTRYGTIVLSIVQSLGISIWVTKIGGTAEPIVLNAGFMFFLTTVVTLTTGTAFIMWLGEQITDRGIGNGISLIIFAGIVAGVVPSVLKTVRELMSGQIGLLTIAVIVAVMIAVTAAVVFVERGQRRIPIQYASRVQGRRMMRGTQTYLPLRVNTAGVIPVIFASSLLALPMGLFSWAGQLWPDASWLRIANEQLQWRMPVYDIAYVLLIIFFCFFYTSIVFNPMDTAENMKRVGGFIPGVRPGKSTAQYIDSVLTKLTTAGAIYLALISILPIFLLSGLPLDKLRPAAVGEFFARVLPGWVLNGTGIQFYFGGTSLLIVIGVAMDTIQQIESQLVMRHYDGFLKGTRIRGRRG